ncbi:MAG: hypothetical protein Q9168_007274 [Polycauliona sp. 1 TL-2023]
MSSSSSSNLSSSDSCSRSTKAHHKRRRKHGKLPIRPSSSPSTPSASEKSTTTNSHSLDLSTDSSEESPTDSSDSIVTEYHRICHGRLPKSIKRRSQLPDYNTLMTRYIAPERYPSSSHSSSNSSDDTSSSITVTSSSGSEAEDSSDSDDSSTSESSSDSDSDSDPNFPSTVLPPHIAQTPLPTTSPLHNRLSTFLPTIRASNAELERERLAGTLHNRNLESLSPAHDGESISDQEKPYIEMNLGLGVLEEQRNTAGDLTPLGTKRGRSRESEIRPPEVGEDTNPLETLMGRRGARTPETRERKRRKVRIEVVD